jgi:short-subunit dehydrogenase
LLLKSGYKVLGISRTNDFLNEIDKDIIHNFKLLELDLTNEENYKKIFYELKDKNVVLFFNNAGCGVYGEFEKTNAEEHSKMLKINILTLKTLSNLYLKFCYEKQINGKLVNIGSIACVAPGPFLSSYYASKKYVLYFTKAVNYELKMSGSKTRAFCILPPQINTNFISNSLNLKVNKISKIDIVKIDKFTKVTTNKILHSKKSVITCGFSSFFILNIVAKIVPEFLMMKFIYKFQKRRLENESK